MGWQETGTGGPQWVCRKNKVTYSSSNMGVYYFPNTIKLRSVPFMPALPNYYCFLHVEVEMSYFSPDLLFFLFCGFHVLKLTKRSNVSSVMVRSSCFHVTSQPIKQCQARRCYWRKHFYGQDFSCLWGWGTRADCYHCSEQQHKPPHSYLDPNWPSFMLKWICAHLWFAWDFITACESWFSASVPRIQTQTHISFCLLHLSGANAGTNNSLPVLSLPDQQLIPFFFFFKPTGFGFHYSKGWLTWRSLLFTSWGHEASSDMQ